MTLPSGRIASTALPYNLSTGAWLSAYSERTIAVLFTAVALSFSWHSLAARHLAVPQPLAFSRTPAVEPAMTSTSHFVCSAQG